MKFAYCLAWCTASSLTAGAAAAASSSFSNARLPFSLQKVVADLQQQGSSSENGGGEEEMSSKQLTTACLITSQSITRREKKSLLQSLVPSTEESSTTTGATAIGTKNGLILALPDQNNADDSSLGVIASGGNALYYPSAVDLTRGEGLFTTLAPAMEQILASSSSDSDHTSPSLVVVVPDDDTDNPVSVEMAREQLEKAAEAVLAHLVVGKNSNKQQPLSLLQDVFVGGVHYISKSRLDSDLNVLAALGGESASSGSGSGGADTIASRIQQAAAVTASSSSSSTTIMAGNDLASARILGPKSRIVLQECIQSVLSQTASNDDDDEAAPRRLILDFGNLVRTSLQQGLSKLDQTLMNPTASSVQTCLVTKQIRQNFAGQFHQGVANELQEQLSLLQEACLDDFKKGLSKLILSPKLASDMDAVGNTAIVSFAKKAKSVVTGATTSSLASQVYDTAKQEFAAKIKQQCTSRLLTARANGKFRPLPRKGVTVGLHWLLPKPFGNDYRQEPWMVHATDNMVYVPQGKVQNVNPKDVQSGDWKSKIVPSPIGNDMIYVQ